MLSAKIRGINEISKYMDVISSPQVGILHFLISFVTFQVWIFQ